MTVEELPERHQLHAQLCLLEGLELLWDAPGAVAAPACAGLAGCLACLLAHAQNITDNYNYL